MSTPSINDDRESLIIIAHSPQITFAIGKIVGGTLVTGDVVALIGDMGAGKTLFTQGIAKGMGIPEQYTITSPTFNLINEYPGRLPLYHMDIYRLEGTNDLEDIGFEEYLKKDGVTVIEWAEKINKMIPAEALSVYLSCLDDMVRKIEIWAQKNKILQISKDLVEESVERCL